MGFQYRIIRLNPIEPDLPEWLVVNDRNQVIGMHDDWNKANRQVYQLEHTQTARPAD